MLITQTAIPDAYRIIPAPIPDERGRFWEVWRSGELAKALGRPFTAVQVNQSSSQRGTLRGVHDFRLPSGQANVITCVRGRVRDALVDLRVGSPTFGEVALTELDEWSGTAVIATEGIGHAFLALADEVCMHYSCSAEYTPGSMIEVDALDPALGIAWDLAAPPLRSAKDLAAPSLSAAAAAGLLPTYRDCLAHYEATRSTL